MRVSALREHSLSMRTPCTVVETAVALVALKVKPPKTTTAANNGPKGHSKTRRRVINHAPFLVNTAVPASPYPRHTNCQDHPSRSPCVNDEAQWRRADVRKRIAGDQRQLFARGTIKHASILGPYDFSGRDPIVVRPFCCGELNVISYGNVAKLAKYGIPMRGNTHIAGMRGQGRPGNMAGSESQRSVVIAFEHHRR